MTHPIQNPPPGHTAWLMVAMSFFIGLTTGGLYLFTRGIFLKPMAEDLNLSRLDISLAFTLTTVMMSLSAPLWGWIADRVSLSRLITVIIVWTALGYFLLALVDSRLQLLLVLATTFGLATFAVDTLCTPKLIVSWFAEKPGLALAISGMGITSGGIIWPTLTTWLIEQFGWRYSYQLAGGLSLFVIAPMAALLIRERVQSATKLLQDPANSDTQQRVHTDNQEQTTNGSLFGYLKDQRFWAIAIIFGIGSAVFQAMNGHLFAHLTDVGSDEAWAAATLTAMAICAVVAKPGFGWLIDNVPAGVPLYLSGGCMAGGVLLLLLTVHPSGLFMAGVLFGLGFGGLQPLRNTLVARVFGAKDFAQISGSLRLIMLPPVLIALPAAGWAYDQNQNYDAAFSAFLISYLITIPAIELLRRTGWNR